MKIYADHTSDQAYQEIAGEMSKYKRHAQNFADKLQELMRLLKVEGTPTLGAQKED